MDRSERNFEEKMLGLDVACEDGGSEDGPRRWACAERQMVMSSPRMGKRKGRGEGRSGLGGQKGRVPGSTHSDIISTQVVLTLSPDHFAYLCCFDKVHFTVPVLLLLNTVSGGNGEHIQSPIPGSPEANF